MNKTAALIVSVLLNLFLIAVVGGHVWRSHTQAAASGNATPFAQALFRAKQVLPPKDAAAFGEVIRRDLPLYTVSIVKLRHARQNLNEQIVAANFNPTATRQAIATAQAARNDFLEEFSGTLVEALGQVSPEGRRKLVAELPFRGRMGSDSP